MSSPSTSGKKQGELRPFERAKLKKERDKLKQEKASLIKEINHVGKKRGQIEAEQQKEKKDAEVRQALLKDLGPLLPKITPTKRPHHPVAGQILSRKSEKRTIAQIFTIF